MKSNKSEDKLRNYIEHKYEQKNITTLLNMVNTVVKENDELKKRIDILEQILHMHLPIIEDKRG